MFILGARMTYCKFCGSEIPISSHFCGYCGNILASASDTPTLSSDFHLVPAHGDPTFISKPLPSHATDDGKDEENATIKSRRSEKERRELTPRPESLDDIAIDFPIPPL